MSEAPRWRLIEPHYLNVPELPDGTRVEWEHKETSRETGRTVRKLFQVPMLLDPRDPADCNYPGEIIVTHAVDGVRIPRQDLIFIGPPTPGMEPLNEAAEAITAECREKWEHPIESLPTQMSDGESAFLAKMIEAFTNAQAPAPAAAQVVPRAQYDELKERLERLEAALAVGKSASSAERRV